MRKNKYTFFGVVNTWSQLLVQACKQWKVFGVYAAFLTFVGALFGHWSYSCHTAADFWCLAAPKNQYVGGVAYLCIFGLLMIYLTGAFITDLHNSLTENGVFKPRDVFSVNAQKVKTAFTLTVILFGAVVSLLGAYYIIRKPANPSFDIEFGYFLIVFVLLLIPLMMIRCAACFSYYLHDGKFAFHKVFDHTSGRSYISVMMFLLLLIVLLILNMRLYGTFTRLSLEYNSFTTALAVEFADNLFKLICLAAFLLFAEAQYVRMQQTEELRQAEAAAAAAAKAEAEEETSGEDESTANLTAKAAKKKKNQRKAQTSSATKTKRKTQK